MSDSNDILENDSPGSPTEDRLDRFFEEADNLAKCGRAVDVAVLLADRPDLFDRGQMLVEAIQFLRKNVVTEDFHPMSSADVPANVKPLPDPFPGEFRIRMPLGEGTFGKVWLADDLHLGRQVALKTLHVPADADPYSLAALRKEAGFLAGLDHRNVVKVHAWRQAGEQHYLVLEYVSGGSLADLLKRKGSLPWQRAARYIGNAAEGLREVHAKGIIHRDIKASNILWDSARDEAKLTDFGVAGRLGATRTAVGTPVFMAPEALLGRATESSDVYGLAATLFHLTTGELPFPPMAPNEAAGHGRGLPQADERFRQVPQRLESVIRAGLAADQAERPSLPYFIDLLWGALNQSLVDEFLPRPADGSATPAVGLQMVISRKTGTGWRPVATTHPQPDSLSRDVRRVPPRPVQARVRTGEPLRLEVEVDRPGYLAVFNVGPTGNLNLLYPVSAHGDSPTIEAGRAMCFDDLVLDAPAGRERMLAVWSSRPIPVSEGELRGLADAKGEDESRACRSNRDIVRVRDGVEEVGKAKCRVVVLELEHEPSD